MWLMWRKFLLLFLLVWCLLGICTQQAFAVVLTCRVTGTVTAPDNTPLANTLIIFNSLTTQVVQSQVIGQTLISTQTNASGALDVVLTQGQYLQVTIGTSAPFTVIVPGQSTVSWSDLLTSAQLPNGGIQLVGVAGAIPYFPDANTIAVTAELTQHALVVGGGAVTAPATLPVGVVGQALVSGGASADPSWAAPQSGGVFFAGPNGELSTRRPKLFWDDVKTALCIGCTDTTIGGTVDSQLTVKQFNGGTALAVMTTGGNPRFSLNPLDTGGFVLLDYDGTWHNGVSQIGGNIGIGTQTPLFGLDVRTGVHFEGIRFETVDVDLNIHPHSSGTPAQLRLYQSNLFGTHYVGFRAANEVIDNVLWTLPDADGLSGQVLSTNGGGVLSWVTAGGGSGMSNPMTTTGDLIYASNTASPATPARRGIGSEGQCLVVSSGLPAWGACAGTAAAAGSDTQVQYNSSGSFGADSTFTWNNTAKTLGISAVNTGTMVPVAIRNTSSGVAAQAELRIGNDTQANALIMNVNSSAFSGGEASHAHIVNRLAAPLFLGGNNGNQLRLDSSGARVSSGALQVLTAPSLTTTPTANPVPALSAALIQGTIGGSSLVYEHNVGLTCTSTAGCVGQYIGVDTGTNTGNTWALNSVVTLESTIPNASVVQGYELDFNNLKSHRGETDGIAGLVEAGLGPTYGLSITGAGTFRNTAAILFAGPLTAGNEQWNRGIAIPLYAVKQSSFADYGNPEKSIDIRGNPGYGIYQSDSNPLNYFNGKVGIGVSSPTTGLDVHSGVLVSGTGFTTEGVHPTFLEVSGSTAELRLRELTANGTNRTGFRAPASLASNVIYTLPTADGTAGQVLSTDGSKTLSWITPSGGGGSSIGAGTNNVFTGTNTFNNTVTFAGTNNAGVSINHCSELVSVGSGTATAVTSTCQIPADAIVIAVPVRVNVAPGGTTTMVVTATTSGTEFQKGASISSAVSTTDPGTKNTPINYNGVAAQTITLTFDAPTSDALGRVRVEAFYYTVQAPLS